MEKHSTDKSVGRGGRRAGSGRKKHDVRMLSVRITADADAALREVCAASGRNPGAVVSELILSAISKR